ncbi:MAG TPA: hypothetical protein VIV54_16315 [Burkholderiales bacterium]
MRALLPVAALFLASAALAQVRTIPPEAKPAQMRHVEGGVIELNGKRGTLAPGAQIRDQANRIIVPSALPPGSLVKYSADANGLVQRVWVLTPEEARRAK